MNSFLKLHETLEHHVEHQFASVSDNIKNLIGKLEKREDKSESRLENLEALIKQVSQNRDILVLASFHILKEVDGTLDKRLTSLEMQMKGSVERKMNNIESSLDRKMSTMEEKASTIVTTNAGSWKLPFLFLLVIITAAGIGLYFFYKSLLKKHLL